MRDTLDSINHEGHTPALAGGAREEHQDKRKGNPFVHFVHLAFTPENIWAFVLFLIVIALIIFTTDSSPAWIYQGF